MLVRWMTMVCVVGLVWGCGGGGGEQENNNHNSTGDCGNGIVDPDEVCDNGVQNSDTEPDACRSNCTPASCGDGVADSADQCDGDDLAGAICADVGNFTGGNLSCDLSCQLITTDCSVCGDGAVGSGEECDGNNIPSTCADWTGLQNGELECTANCEVDATACYDCGDGEINPASEDCDGTDLGGDNCGSIGFTGGALSCGGDCQFNTTTCFSFCGNGEMETGEPCDGNVLSTALCTDLGASFVTGGTVICSPSCQLSAEHCSQCGNGVLDSADEQCDASLLAGASCGSVTSFPIGGTLACDACRYDLSGCDVAPTCGNGGVDANEQCDGNNLNGQTCALVSSGLWGGGSLSCHANCFFDTAGCVKQKACGNGVLETVYGEECDGGQLGSSTCSSLGFGAGFLSCTPQCTFDLSGCSGLTDCGDGTLQPNLGEQCDGGDLGGLTCADLGMAGGTLTCTGACTLNASLCNSCGDGAINGTDQCDGADLAGQSCESLGYFGGTLDCHSNCAYDLTQCTGCNGDGNIDFGEQCDGSNFGSQDCTDFGYAGGILVCANCLIVTTLCDGCGNAALDSGETCDGSVFGGLSCWSEYGLPHGNLTCSGDCQSVTGPNCHTCGNSTIDGPEICDDTALGGADCQGQGFVGGSLACDPGCLAFDTAGCHNCGDSTLDAGEDCDGGQFGAATCASETTTRTQGSLLCTAGCAIDTTGCYECGDSTLHGPEVCDGSTGSETCVSQGLDGGTLACAAGCLGYDTAGCFTCGNTNCEAAKGENRTNCPQDCGWLEVTPRWHHGCARRGDNTLWCFGWNPSQLLGIGPGPDTCFDGATPYECAMNPEQVPISGVVKFAVGLYFTCAALTDGTVWCWGQNIEGKLGLGDTTNRTAPTQVPGLTGVVDLAAGYYHACAVQDDGTAWCWGSNGNGQLGNNYSNDTTFCNGHPCRRLPVQVGAAGLEVTDASEIDAGSEFTCLKHQDETLSCFGRNSWYQHGDGTNSQHDIPTPVPGLTGVQKFSTGETHTCATVTNGDLYCWGRSGNGQAGCGACGSAQASPVLISLGDAVVDVGAGSLHTCVVLDTGAVWCTGNGYRGQLGDGLETQVITFQAVPGVANVMTLGVGDQGNCAVLTDGTSECWGYNTLARIGIGYANGPEFNSSNEPCALTPYPMINP